MLASSTIEKLAMGALIFFRPTKRTPAITAAAIVDGTFAVIYIAYLGGL
jgi:hypothetical protein